MRTMTATEAARGFSDVLDAAEHGESVTITRGGKPVARLVPANVSNGSELAEFFSNWHSEPDDGFADVVLSARDEDRRLAVRDPWSD